MVSKRRSTAEKNTPLKKKRIEVETTVETSVEEIESALHKHLIAFLKTRQQHSDNIYLNIVNQYLNKNEDAFKTNKMNIQETIEYLTNFLKHADCTRGINKIHVASLLFPWAVQTLLYQSREHKETFPMNLIWSSFAQSYESLISNGDISEELLQNLPQGTLNKLVPYALEIAFTSEIEDGNDMVVTRCLLWMLRLNTYRPTMDHVCSVLIPLLDTLVMQISKPDETHLMVSTNQYNIIRNVMKLILSRLEARCSNPKKTFQTMASESSLVFLARMYCVRSNDISDEESMHVILRKIISITFFDGQYHMDGFRSMNLYVPMLNEKIQSVKDCEMQSVSQKKRKGSGIIGHEQSYQKLIIQTFESVLSSNDESKHDARKWIVQILPMVLEEFMKESSRMNESTTRKSRVDMTAKMQLRFWSHMMQPLLCTIGTYDKENTFSNYRLILNATQESLEILLQYECYLPSYSDPDNEHQKYLEAVGETILKFSEHYTTDTDIETILNQFKVLFALNHNIFHNNLTRLMVCAMGMTSRKKQQVNLFTYICKVYEKLRQINYFLNSIIESRFQISDVMIDFIHDPQFTDGLSSAIYSLPHGQLNTVINLMDDHILKALSKDQRCLDFVVDIYVIILKAIHVTETNAAKVYKLCGDSETNIIPQLVSMGTDGIIDIECHSTKSGLYLLSWIITVSTRCIFWLNDTSISEDIVSHFDIFPTIKSISETRSFNERTSLGAIQHLACNKLIQLHSLVYIREQTEGIAKLNCKQEDGPKSKQLIADASELADFIISAAASRVNTSNRETNWRIVCEHLGIISTYAKNEQLECFLRWFMTAYACDESEEAAPNEREAIASLLLDSSFFETFYEADIVTSVAFSVIQRRLKRSDMIQEISSWDDCCTKINLIFQTKRRDILNENHAKFITRILRLLKALLPDSAALTYIYWRLYGCFTILTESVWLLKDNTMEADVLDLIDTSISILISDLENIPKCQIECVSIHENTLSQISLMIKKILRYCNLDPKGRSKLVVSGPSLTTILLRRSWDQKDETNISRACSSLIGDAQNLKTDISASLIISRHCIHMASKILQDVNPEKRLIIGAGHLFHFTKNLCENCAGSEDRRIFGRLILPLIADVVRLGRQLDERDSGDYDQDWFQNLLSVFVDKSISILKGSYNTFDDSVENGCLYFLASILDYGRMTSSEANALMVNMQDIIISQFKKRDGFIHPLLDSSYALICRQSDSDALRALGKILLNNVSVNALQLDPSNLSGVLYCFHIMLLSAAATDMTIVADFVKPLLLPAIRLVRSKHVHDKHISWSLQVRRIFGLLGSIISNSGGFVLKGHDYAAIFATINTIFIENSVNIDGTLFVSACHLVTAMLKVNRKLTYGCVPSLTDTLRQFLEHLIKLPSIVNGTDTAGSIHDSMHAMTALFQLLPEHKDVIKKHMMHLVLFFVDRAQLSMDTSKKTQMEPLLFNLLDSLSDFEIKQLSTMMQPSTRSTLQSFFKIYNKNKYTGAF